MPEYVSSLNPRMLVWARETAGLSIEEAAQTMDKPPDALRDWETGASAPTYIQLETLAYKVYKRPVAIFFLPEPPDEPEPQRSFRTLPQSEVDRLASVTRFRLRQARALQLSLYTLTGGRNPAPNRIFRDFPQALITPVPALAADVRTYLDISIAAQTEKWESTDQALKAWREAIESSGVFVFKNTFPQKDFSGFCLFDSEFPIIYLNNSTPKTRQVFTIFHELAHILTGVSGITTTRDRFIQRLTGNARQIEIFCNAFAAEFLVPMAHFRTTLTQMGTDDEAISRVADAYKVSREVILRRLLDTGGITSEYYEQKASVWTDEYLSQPSKGSGGNYYLTTAAYLGDKYMRLAFRRFYEGTISLYELADHLGIRATSVPGLEQRVLETAET